MPDFTPTQGRYLAYIHAYTQGFGLPPAYSEIAECLGVSSPSVNQMIKTLEAKSLIRRNPGEARSIAILIDPSDIPKWSGKRITRTVYEWTRVAPPKAKHELAEPPSSSGQIYVFKITLMGSEPEIWRRIETSDVPLSKFHAQIQTAMGWTDSHLHQFLVGGMRYVDPRSMDDAFPDPNEKSYTGLSLSQLVSKHGRKLKMIYEYDFGDSWEHEVKLEKIVAAEPTAKYPRCVDGARACPPEDIGGIFGFENYLEAIGDPNHEEHEDYLEWNGPFDPTKFDPQRATKAMKKGLPDW